MGRLRYLRLSHRSRVLIWLCALLLLLAGLCTAVMVHMKPILTNLAVSRIHNTVNRIVVSAVNDELSRGVINYDALVTMEKDAGGRITALRSNMSEVNRLQSAVSDSILQRLGEVSTVELAIPVGTLTGSALLAGRGTPIRIRMQSVGSASASFHDELIAAGINQTRHRILLRIDVHMSILLPGFTTSTRISNDISVAETVIVGEVPETYTYFSTLPDQLPQYAEDYIMNNG